MTIMVLLIISLLKSSQNAFHCCYLGSVNLHSYQQCKRVPFSPHLFICRFLNDCLSDWCQMHFSNNQWCCTSFHVFVSHLYIFFGEMSISVFGPFCFDLVGFFFFILSCINCLYILEVNPLSIALFESIFSHSEVYLFILFMVPLLWKSF